MLRQNASIWLAPWHNYKHAVELVWKQYANMLFAPLFHNLYPQNKFIIKYPSPQEPTMFMLFVAKAYPMFKPQLVAAIDRVKAGNLATNFKRLSSLRDIQILCEFLIPAVPYECRKIKSTKYNCNVPKNVQVVDYGLAMKSDNGVLVTKHLALLLRVNLMFKQKNAYCRSMFMHMLLLLYQGRRRLPAWQMYEKSASVFNEEVGEISLSVLSRVVLGDTLQSDFEHMSKLYLLQHHYRAVAKEIRIDEQRKQRAPTGYTMLAKRELAQTKVTDFMLATIASIEANTYRIYSGKTNKTNPAYQPKSNESADAREERKSCLSFWLAHSSNERQVGTNLRKLEQDAKNKYCQTWGLKIKDVWPEMNKIPPEIASQALARAAPDLERLRAAQQESIQFDEDATESEEEVSSDADEGVPPIEMLQDFVEEKQ